MDSGHLREVKEIEITHLHLRYAHTRIHRPERVSSLASSIERFGQIIPVIALREGVGSFVLIDGYLRVNALRRCRRDTVRAEIWECKEEEALVEVLVRAHSRKWDFIEEAALIWELHQQYHLSQSRIASLVGRKQGWVSGRLALYQALSEDLLELIPRGASPPGRPPSSSPQLHAQYRSMAKYFPRIFPKRICPPGTWPFCSATTRRPIVSNERTWCVNPSSS